MGYGAAEELVVLSPHPSSAAAVAAAAAEAAAGGRDPAALERKLNLARWRSGGVRGSGKVVALVASSSSAAAAAAAAAAGSSVPFEDESIETLERALAEASAAAVPDDDDHASFIRIPPPLRKSTARFFVKDRAVARFWENSESTPAEVASAAAAAALGALRAARSALGARALLPAPPAVLVSLNPALAEETEWRGSLLVATPELGEESDDDESEDDEEKVAAAEAASHYFAAAVVPPSVAAAVSGSLRKGRAAPDQRHCLEEVSAVFEVAEWVAHWSGKGFVLGLGK